MSQSIQIFCEAVSEPRVEIWEFYEKSRELISMFLGHSVLELRKIFAVLIIGLVDKCFRAIVYLNCEKLQYFVL